jgi:hypothetical protein
MVVLKVGLLRKPLVLCTSGKIYQSGIPFILKFHIIYTPLYIQEKQVELHPASQNLIAALTSTLYYVSQPRYRVIS